MSTILDYLTLPGKSKQTSDPPPNAVSNGIAKVLKPQQDSNMGRQIMENMESVMKSLKRKKKHKKHKQKRSNKTMDNPTEDEEGESESLAVVKSNWLTARKSKEPETPKQIEEPHLNPKKNAFKMLMLNGGKGDMASNDENNTRKISPDANVGKRKLSATRKETTKGRKLKAAANEDPEDPRDEEDSPKSPVKKRRKKKLFECYVETYERKRTVPEEPPLLVVDTESDAVDTPSRPRRSCASKVSYVDPTSPISSKKPSGKTIPATVTSKTAESVPIPEEPAPIVIDVEAIDDQSPATEKTTKKKLAPLFVKALPKPTVDPKVLEARQSFLKSDIPEKMRQEMEKKRLVQEEVDSRQLCLFPEISHVPRISGDVYLAIYDDLTLFPNPDPMSESDSPLLTYSVPETMKVTTSKKAAPVSAEVCAMYLTKSDAQKKQIVRSMKAEGTTDFPTYMIYKMLTKRQNATAAEDALFTDKFKPSNSKEFVFNLIVINELRDYLESFINPPSSSAADTGSSYETEDDDEYSNSMDSFTNGANAHGKQTVVLYGPCSTGKTSAVYAIANELKCNVIEINASSKRNGAKVLHKLMEATQSHKVPTAKMSLSRKVLRRMEREDKRMSIILIEDVDLIFAEDNGFLAAITQLMSLTKRPIILTTNQRNSSTVRKFFDCGPNFKFLHFRGPPRTEDCLTYLTLIGLVNGCHIDRTYLLKMFESCNGDLRRAMLQLNFITMTKEVILHWEEEEEEKEQQLDIPCFNLNDMPAKEGQEDKSGDWCRDWVWTLDSLAVADTWTKREDAEMLEPFMEMCSLGESLLAGKCPGEVTRYEDPTFDVANSISYRNRSCTRATKFQALDVEPILRDICRSECDRKDNGKQRSSTKFSHYLLRERDFEFPAVRSKQEDLEFFTRSCGVFQAAEEQ